jgi:hypothetical protein
LGTRGLKKQVKRKRRITICTLHKILIAEEDEVGGHVARTRGMRISYKMLVEDERISNKFNDSFNTRNNEHLHKPVFRLYCLKKTITLCRYKNLV